MSDIIDENFADKRPLILKLSEQKASQTRKNLFNPPATLGRPEKGTSGYKEVMAMDECFRNVLSRSFKNQLQYAAFPMFVGYGLLSNLSQEALIRAGVETIADDMTRKPIELYYDDDAGNEKEDLINNINSDLKKYKIKEKINTAMLKDGYFGGCLAYIDVGDLDDEEKAEPLILDKKTFKAGSFRGLKIIEPVNISAGTYNTTDPTDEHYFNPEWWYVLGKRYHASRFLYFASNETPLLLKPAYNFFGIPQAQLALDYVANFVANRESAQELLNKFSLTCFGTDMSQGLQQNGSWADLINRMKMFNKMKTNNGTFVYNKETEEMSQINTPLSGVRDIVDMSLNLLTAIWRIPKIRYIGEGEGGLNVSSSEQMRSYYDYILAMQEKVLTEPFAKLLKILQLNQGLEPDEKLLFKFPYLWEMNEKERAELNKMLADRDVTYISNGVLSQEEVRQRLSLDKNSGYTMIDVNDLPEAEAQPLEHAEEEEQNEEDRQAMDELNFDELMSMDDPSFENIHPRGFRGWFRRKREELKAKSKINQIKIDFSKDNILPEINESDAKKIGVKPRKVRLKKNIIDRNRTKHPDVKDEETISIIGNALYKPEHILTAKGSNKYFHFIGRRNEKESPLVLLDVEISEDGYFDIVHYFKMRDSNKEHILKTSEEVGLPSPT